MVWQSAEAAAVAWAKANAVLSPLLGDRVVRRIASSGQLAIPYLVVFRVGGDTEEEAPVDRPLLQWDVYGRPADPEATWTTAESAGLTLLEELHSAQPQVVGGAWLYGFTILSHRPIPEPSGELARYSIDTIALIR